MGRSNTQVVVFRKNGIERYRQLISYSKTGLYFTTITFDILKFFTLQEVKYLCLKSELGAISDIYWPNCASISHQIFIDNKDILDGLFERLEKEHDIIISIESEEKINKDMFSRDNVCNDIDEYARRLLFNLHDYVFKILPC